MQIQPEPREMPTLGQPQPAAKEQIQNPKFEIQNPKSGKRDSGQPQKPKS
jgi:hypothetical protein